MSGEFAMSLTRRDALKIGGRSLVATAFLNHVASLSDAANPIEDQLEKWKTRLGEVAKQLGSGKITALQWQEEMDRIYAGTPITDLLKLIKFDDLKQSMLASDLKGRGELFRDIPIPGVVPAVNHEPDKVLISKLAYVEKGQHIPPHGHGNMASAFLCVSGDFHVRLFDRLEHDDESMVVRNTVEETKAGVGTWSSISDYRNNVHWLTANSDNCFLFTCKLIRVEDDRKFHGRINIDLRAPKTIGADTYRARKISFAESKEYY
jgi:hypothetical protein